MRTTQFQENMFLTITTDFHTHVCMASAETMAAAALEKGITEIGFSEHIYQLDEGFAIISNQPLEGPRITLAQYVDVVRGAARPGLKVRLGLEVDDVDYGRAAIDSMLAPVDWDFILGSVHEVDGNSFEAPQTFEPGEGVHFWRRYFDCLNAAIESSRFDVITHPVRMRLRNPHLPPDFDQLLAGLAEHAKARDVALEINGNDVRRSPEEALRLAHACVAAGTPISVGSDAHLPKDVARAHEQTTRWLAELGVKAIRTFARRQSRELPVTVAEGVSEK